MRTDLLALLLLGVCMNSLPAQEASVVAAAQESESACDSAGFLRAAIKAEELRKQRRVSAAEFAKMASEQGTIVLDARGQSAYANLHVKGSVNLPYTEFSELGLQRVIPDKSTRILLYCRNNLVSIQTRSPAPGPDLELEFSKGRSAGLNIPAYITLYIYGYRNVWELNPAVDPNHTPIPFERPWEHPDKPSR